MKDTGPWTDTNITKLMVNFLCTWSIHLIKLIIEKLYIFILLMIIVLQDVFNNVEQLADKPTGTEDFEILSTFQKVIPFGLLSTYIHIYVSANDINPISIQV